jgi:Phosphotransferase enzyme family
MMTARTQPEPTPYRLIVTRQGATELLLSNGPAGCSLPQIDVLARARVAEQLVSQTRKVCQLETYCLLTGDLPASSGRSSPDRYAVMESLCRDGDSPSGAIWIPAAEAAWDGNLSPADQAAVQGALLELGRRMARPESAPFARPGWIEELFDWVRSQIEPRGLRLTGAFRQYNAAPTFSLIQIETTGTALWFKATGRPNRRELGISVALDCLFPGYVPRVVGVYPIWNGWLSEEIAAPLLDDSADARSWAAAAAALAELQIASVGKTDVLLESGCKDLTLDQLARQIEPFLASAKELMSMQTKPSPRILTDSEIDALGDRLSDALAGIARLGIPDTLGHLDPNPRNIVASPGRCCFLDWAEGSVTHPLFTFEYVCEHARRRFPQDQKVIETLVATYLQSWESRFSPQTLTQAMSLTPLLSVFACAVADQPWSSPDALRSPSHAGYLRSLARRAYREADALAAGAIDV